MSAAEALMAARAAGIQLGVDGDDLVLEAAAQPPSVILGGTVAAQSRDRSGAATRSRWLVGRGLAVVLRRTGSNCEFDGGLPRADAEAQAFECCVVEWLNRNPTPSAAGRCVWCGQAESHGAVVVPYGTEPGTHAWLHAECWPAWQEVRRSQAREALARMGIGCIVTGGCGHPSNEPQQR